MVVVRAALGCFRPSRLPSEFGVDPVAANRGRFLSRTGRFAVAVDSAPLLLFSQPPVVAANA